MEKCIFEQIQKFLKTNWVQVFGSNTDHSHRALPRKGSKLRTTLFSAPDIQMISEICDTKKLHTNFFFCENEKTMITIKKFIDGNFLPSFLAKKSSILPLFPRSKT